MKSIDSTSHRLRSVAFGVGAVLVPAAVGAGVGAALRSRRDGVIAGGVVAALLAAGRWQLQRWFNDVPEYAVERRVGDLEIRRYDARVEARTRVGGDFDQALRVGFRRLFRYIDGGNQREESIEMTSPVTATTRGDEHVVSFTMPAGQQLSDLPRPKNLDIELATAAPRRIAVLTYRGRYRKDAVDEQVRRALGELAEAGLEPRGEPTFAGFDPPTTIPWLRRNEIWIELA